MGTPSGMSPRADQPAARTSISARHLRDRHDRAYEMFAGKTPFLGDTLQAIMTGHLFTEPPRLEDVPKNLGISKPIAEVIDRMLVKDANDRYGSAADVLADLRDVDRTASRPSPTRSRRRSRRARARPSSTAGGPSATRPTNRRRRTPRSARTSASRRRGAVTDGLLLCPTTSQHKPVDTAAVTKPAPDTTPKPVPPAPAPERSTTIRCARTPRRRCARRSRKRSRRRACRAPTRSARSRISRRCRRSPT